MPNTNDEFISFLLPVSDYLVDIKNLAFNGKPEFYYKNNFTVPMEIDFSRKSNSSEQNLDSNLENKFKKLVEEWKIQNPFSSNIVEICSHSSYQKIIGMGPAAVPLILRELKNEINHWFWALKAITNHDPVKDSERGNLKLMTKAWLKWGEIRKML